jgi:hypothetical protein
MKISQGYEESRTALAHIEWTSIHFCVYLLYFLSLYFDSWEHTFLLSSHT